MFMAQQCRGEAQRQRGAIRDELIGRSRMLSHAMRSAYSTDPDQRAEVVMLIDGAIDCLVDVMTARADQLTKGTP